MNNYTEKIIEEYSDHINNLYREPISEMFKPLLEITEMNFPPLKWLVPDLIVDTGTTLLAGPPKIGKSAFLLKLIGDIANVGQRAFYFAGEDGYRRLKDRTKKLRINPEYVMCHAGREYQVNRNEYLDIVSDYLTANPDIKLAVFDTMELSLKPKMKKREYEDWVTDLQPWNDLAHQLNIQILMVHHCNKGETKGIESILGSQGIAASFETLLIMQREQGNVYLEVIGKDVASNTILLEKLDFGYKIGNKINPNQIGLGPTRKAVLEAIKENNDKTQKELIEIMTNEGFKTSKGKSISKQQMSDCIIGLLEEGLIGKTVLAHKETYYDSPLT